MNIFILSALKSEMGLLLKYYKPELVNKNRKKIFFKHINNNYLFFGNTGVGEKNVKRFFEYYRSSQIIADLVIFIGYAGAVNPALKAGDLVLAREIFNQSLNKVIIPEFNNVLLNKENLLSQDLKILQGKGYYTDHLVYREEKYNIRQNYPDIDFVDMESWETALFCRENHIPLLILRSVSDNIDFNLPGIKFVQDSWEHIDKPELFRHLLKKPSDLVHIFSLMRNIKLAEKRLFKAVIKILLPA